MCEQFMSDFTYRDSASRQVQSSIGMYADDTIIYFSDAWLRRRRSKPSVYSACELVHNIVFESCRVAGTYVGVFNWLVSYTVCD